MYVCISIIPLKKFIITGLQIWKRCLLLYIWLHSCHGWLIDSLLLLILLLLLFYACALVIWIWGSFCGVEWHKMVSKRVSFAMVKCGKKTFLYHSLLLSTTSTDPHCYYLIEDTHTRTHTRSRTQSAVYHISAVQLLHVLFLNTEIRQWVI